MGTLNCGRKEEEITFHRINGHLQECNLITKSRTKSILQFSFFSIHNQLLIDDHAIYICICTYIVVRFFVYYLERAFSFYPLINCKWLLDRTFVLLKFVCHPSLSYFIVNYFVLFSLKYNKISFLSSMKILKIFLA